MNIIKASEKHLLMIEKLLYQVHKIHSDNRSDLFVSNERKYNIDELKEIIKNDDSPIYVYILNEEVVGYVFINYLYTSSHSLKKIKTMYIDDFCVEKNYKRQGIGKKLFAFIEDLAKKENCYNITLNVYAFNDDAKAFYKRLKMKEMKTYMEKVIDYEK